MNVRTYWYVEPLDSHTNKVMQSYLDNPVEMELELKKRVKAYEVSYSSISRLKESKKDLHLSFKIYNKRGKYGQVREFDFDNLKKRKK